METITMLRQLTEAARKALDEGGMAGMEGSTPVWVIKGDAAVEFSGALRQAEAFLREKRIEHKFREEGGE